ACGVEREVADWYAHASGALVAQSENALAVADHNGLDTVEAGVLQNIANAIFERQAQKQAARLAKQMAEQLAAQSDRGRIDDRHHLFDVAGQQGIKKSLVG